MIAIEIEVGIASVIGVARGAQIEDVSLLNVAVAPRVWLEIDHGLVSYWETSYFDH